METADMKGIIRESILVKEAILADSGLLEDLRRVVQACIQCLGNGGKLLLCGNGGSAADAQHIAAELSGRFYKDRPALFAEALHVNTSYLTAVANDYGYGQVYARQVEAKGRLGDILIGISTSGNSENVLEALKKAQAQGLFTVGMTGSSGGKMVDFCDIAIRVPSSDTARIQEVHILLGHILCEGVESGLFG